MRRRTFLMTGLAGMGVSACSVEPSFSLDNAIALTSSSTRTAVAGDEAVKIAALKRAILALGPGIADEEAGRIARISYVDPLQWAEEWDVGDDPIFHNMLVNTGRRPRGLCREWADSMQIRMMREGFRTVDWHRAIANHDTIRLEHSTLIVSAVGASMYDGIVLDPWREGGGRLFWTKVTEDPKYDWAPRTEVFALKAAREGR